MAKYKCVLYLPDGNEYDSMEEEGLVFDDEQSAIDSALDRIGCYIVGGETLHLSNPGDYDDNSNAKIDYDIIEID